MKQDSKPEKVKKIEQEKADWWDSTSKTDKQCIDEGLEQLDKGEHLTHEQVRSKIKERFNFK